MASQLDKRMPEIVEECARKLALLLEFHDIANDVDGTIADGTYTDRSADYDLKILAIGDEYRRLQRGRMFAS
jgi:hypothetical protein